MFQLTSRPTRHADAETILTEMFGFAEHDAVAFLLDAYDNPGKWVFVNAVSVKARMDLENGNFTYLVRYRENA